jgi:hypothetical protein
MSPSVKTRCVREWHLGRALKIRRFLMRTGQALVGDSQLAMQDLVKHGEE